MAATALDPGPVIELYKRDIRRALLGETLRHSEAQRVAKLSEL